MMDKSDVVVGMDGGNPKWITLNGTKIYNVVGTEFEIVSGQQATEVRMTFLATDLKVVPYNIDDPEFETIKKALKL